MKQEGDERSFDKKGQETNFSKEVARSRLLWFRSKLVLIGTGLVLPFVSLLFGLTVPHSVYTHMNNSNLALQLYSLSMYLCLSFIVLDAILLFSSFVRFVVFRLSSRISVRIIASVFFLIPMVVVTGIVVIGLFLGWALGSDSLLVK